MLDQCPWRPAMEPITSTWSSGGARTYLSVQLQWPAKFRCRLPAFNSGECSFARCLGSTASQDLLSRAFLTIRRRLFQSIEGSANQDPHRRTRFGSEFLDRWEQRIDVELTNTLVVFAANEVGL